MADNPTSDYVFKAYVVNTAAYDAGEREDSGAWLYFPPQAGEVNELFEKIGLPADAGPGKYFMDGYVSRVDGMKDVLPMYGDISELSAVAQAIAGLSPDDKELLAAVQESPYRLTSLEQFKEFPNNTEFFTLEQDIRRLDDLGWSYLAPRLDMDLTPELRAAIDPVPFGRHAMEEDHGCFTNHGYLTLSGDGWQHDRPLGQEHREPEKKASIRERLEQGKKECAGRQTPSPNKGKAEPEL